MQYILYVIQGTKQRNNITDASSLKGVTQPPSYDSAVSPVIGIMLMLIVTVILAAIISGYVGGMSETKTKPPQLVLQTEVTKGDYVNVSMTVVSAGDGIPTRDLKLITSWKNQTSSGGNSTFSGSKYPTGIVPQKGTSPAILDFGKYTLMGGTKMLINTTDVSNRVDELIFGTDTNTNILPGDPITLTFVHIPSQSTIYKQEIIVRANS